MRYRRDRLDGAHRRRAVRSLGLHRPPRRPWAPRPGYLERIIDGAAHHGLPHRWVEFLKRWDPAHWPRRADKSSSSAPQSLSELLADPGVIEDEQAAVAIRLPRHPRRRARADDRRHRRACRRGRRRLGLRGAPPRPLPAPPVVGALSRRRSPIGSREFLDHVEVAVSVHGYGRDRPEHPTAGRRTQPDAGRAPRAPRRGARLPSGHRPRRHSPRTARPAPRQPGQPGARRRGATRMSPRVRGISPRSPLPGDDGLTPATSALVQGLAATAQSWKLPSA